MDPTRLRLCAHERLRTLRGRLSRVAGPVAVVVALLGPGCGDEASTPAADTTAPLSCEGITCSGHGRCELAALGPVCACDPLWDGALCDRCAAGYHLDADATCVEDASCEPFSCSGNGVCDDALGTVSCVCSLGYEGPSCAVCSGGFHRIADGRCAPDARCDVGAPCGPRGACAVEAGAIACACEDGWAGDRCDRCADGFHADAGECVVDEVCRADTCGGFGRCDVAEGRTACDCDAGHTGADCTACAFGFHRDALGRCPANTSCAQRNPCGPFAACRDATGEVRCECAPGYAGATCRACAPGFHLLPTNLCAADTACLPQSCAGAGACTADGGAVSCACDPGYVGVHCEQCAPGHHRAADGSACVPDVACAPGQCGANGACADAAGEPVCACASGYAGPDCAACASGFSLSEAGACSPDAACGPETCAGRGACDDTGGAPVCACAAGYAGPHCERCALGYHLAADAACVPDEVCDAMTCSGRGACFAVGGVARCDCRYGWGGARCEGCATGFLAAAPDTCIAVP